ncbi:adenosylcobinamide-GDP ribazoletransferase [Spiribacter halobius]|uniref:Adenosylcobinamide-GDP ribazoletransferase n=2 Tax=Sediminicurvatus halobius TaxID=2182432 RepID=A0A2U2N2B1_9GAMM|nr:adenosylcobinamide-GDP ribazoletransferase [Spiribacter halobius]PWG63129.1 adenosylcobinamide-GDP ribazoletransferase [Spiribacter halobius]UEX79925.1 adenosylcobinamide-GDP ribazoletransferase [Spiribacter halobius]
MRGALAALVFLTRLPLPRLELGTADAGRSLPWYPAVGALLGALATLAALAGASASPLLGAAVYVAALAALSGGLHLDGLADTADAWVGGIGDRERTLVIMKDPACGPAAVSLLVAVLTLRLAAAQAVLLAGAWPALLLAPVLGRAAAPALFLSTPYVRAGGLGQALSEHLPRGTTRIALLVTAGVALLGGWPGLAALAAAGALLVALRRAFQRRLGGITGDTTGAAIELCELAALLALALTVPNPAS